MKKTRTAPLLIPQSEIRNPQLTEAVCLGCGCSDSHACVTAATLDAVSTGLCACFWVKVDRELGIGVCSECVDKMGEFEDRVNLRRAHD